MSEHLDKGGDVDVSHPKDVVEFLRVLADMCHHETEENMLFPLMEEYDVPREGCPIDIMLSVHTHGSHIIQKLNTLSEIYGNGNKNVKRDIASAMREYIYLLREHIDKENIVLFPMAEVHIPEDAMENL